MLLKCNIYQNMTFTRNRFKGVGQINVKECIARSAVLVTALNRITPTVYVRFKRYLTLAGI